MINPKCFCDLLREKGTEFFTGVPDSLLKNFCAYVTDTYSKDNHIIAANEGCAIALASGYNFATGKIPLVYMQNSGIGNAVNPLLSLVDKEVYSIPMILLVGWRGEPGIKDEPQHIKQGKVTCSLFDAMEIPHAILSSDEADIANQIEVAYEYVKNNNAPYVFIIRKDTFSEYTLKKNDAISLELSRESAIEKIMLSANCDTAFVSTTGMISRELYELRDKHGMSHETDFLTVGSMGHASQIAYSIALHLKNKFVYCIDGDGASIMQMGGMTTIGTSNISNMVHFVLNNGAHDSVGGQSTVGFTIDLPAIANACGYSIVKSVSTKSELETVLNEIQFMKEKKSIFIEVKVKKGARKDLGRPKTSALENKVAFMDFLKK